MAPVILHIHVVDTTTSYDSLASVPIWPQPRMCVSAEIIDTIKGTYLRPGSCDGGIAGRRKSQDQTLGLREYGCINIAFSPFSQKTKNRGDVTPIGVDTAGHIIIPCDSCYGTNPLLPGNDYVVFLENQFMDYNGSYSFYQYHPYSNYNAEGGIFPIDSSGNVIIQDNYFGYGNSVPLSVFESLLKTDIQSIISH